MKRRIATLAIVGAMAVAAVAPATVFASPANNETTVGYVPGGTSIDELSAIVVVPKDAAFDKLGGTIDNFDVKALVANGEGNYVQVSTTNRLSKNIDVKVTSKNKGVLKNGVEESGLTYTYKTGTDYSTDVTLASNDAAVGTFDADAQGGDIGVIKGQLKLTDTATIDDADFGQSFTDVLTYKFSVEDGDTYPTN